MGRELKKGRRRRYRSTIEVEKQEPGTEDVVRTEEIRVYQKDLYIRKIYYGPNTVTV